MTYIQPLILLLLIIAAIGLIRIRHCKRRAWIFTGFAGVFLVSWPPIDWLLSRPLEARYPVRPIPAVAHPPEAIVVLSGAVAPPIYERPFPLPDEETFERCQYAAWLSRQWHGLPVLACGGRNGPAGPFSVVMREYLSRAGVTGNIWTEEKSRSTYENAFYGAQVLRAHGIARIALVVDAESMPRAAACFRKQGIDVTPAPSSFRVIGTPWSEEFIPGWRPIRRNERTLHEAGGLLWYWMRGWI